MVAFNHDYPPFDAARAVFSEEVLAEVADLRAHGKSWEETAKAVEWDANELRKAVKADPNFGPALERARQEVADETNDEGLARLRKLTESDKPKVALQAHQIIREYLVEQQKNQTRLAVERMRLQATLARASVQRAKQQEAEKVDEDAPRIDPVDGGSRMSIAEERKWAERERKLQADLVQEVNEKGIIVYLWAGDHKLFDAKPGPNDTPLQLWGPADVAGEGQRIYWALPVPYPANPFGGPWLKPEECKRLDPVSPEVVERLEGTAEPSATT